MARDVLRPRVRRAALALALLAISGGPAAAGAAPGQPLVLAEYHVWHGLPSHSNAFSGAFWLLHSRAYDSSDPEVLARHVSEAAARGIDGFVVDWYGPAAPVANTEDRAFMDRATAALLAEAEARGFAIALLYDEGTVRQAKLPPDEYAERVLSDLSYARRYFASPAYLRLLGSPALFVFPYPEVDLHLDWAATRAALGTPVTLIDLNPDPTNRVHDEAFDGFYAWVQPDRGLWDPRGKDWGKHYLKWFYATMRSPFYREKLTVAGVWPGFDDSLADWGSDRFISRRDGHVWGKTWKLARKSRAPVVMIGTWNDFEEGTDIESGVRMWVDLEASSPEILLRSSPLEVVWDERRGEGVVQVYRKGNVIYEGRHAPGVSFTMRSDTAYEIKLWVDGRPEPLARTVKIRAQDRVGRLSPIVVD